VRYDFLHWGPWLAPIVVYFKQLNPGDTGDMKALGGPRKQCKSAATQEATSLESVASP
jgi:hypothetical protein